LQIQNYATTSATFLILNNKEDFMETELVNGMFLIKLDMFVTVALGAMVYYFGVFLRAKLPVLVKLSIPAPAIGGLIMCGLVWFLRANLNVEIQFNGTLQTFFMIIFFCTVGMNASYTLLLKGGLFILAFWAVSTVFAVVQNLAGIGVAKIFGLNPLLGILGGSVSLVGGLGTSGAWGPLFEETYHVEGATTVAIACATFGMIAGSLIGGPFGEFVIKFNKLSTPKKPGAAAGISKTDVAYVSAPLEGTGEVARETPPPDIIDDDEDVVSGPHLMKNLAWLLVAMGVGSILSGFVKNAGYTLPPYLCGMFVAIAIRNIGDLTHTYNVDSKAVGMIGDIALAIYITMAINGMKLWQIVGLALPLIVMMFVQIIVVLVSAYFMVFLLFRKNYDSTVIASGFIGFQMGATPNALICMQALTGKYGPSPKAFFVVPIVGAFLVDITNAVVIQAQAGFLLH
jgi:ESS family glutamate:Na+ symporter